MLMLTAATVDAVTCATIVVAVLAKTDMLGIISSRLLATPLARELLEPITVAERLPSSTAGIFTRKDTSLTGPAAAMAKAVTAAARRLARPMSG